MLNELFPHMGGAFFDMDGTLLDSMGAWSRTPVRYLESLGLQPQENLAERFVSLTFHQQAQVLRQEYGIQLEEGDIVSGYHKLMEDFYRREAREKPGAGRFLSYLRDHGVALYVVSATPGRLVRIALDRAGLSPYFSHIFSAWDLNTSKRKTDIFRQAQQSMGLPAEEIWVFEDALYAMKTAKSMGFPLAAVEEDTAKAQRDEIFRIADLWIPSYEALMQRCRRSLPSGCAPSP